ncbi:MAG TPA: energy transducer TonB [Thermoanaerobaculia bacterium]|jgi:protein TonB
MDLQNELIESSKAKRQKGGWTASVASVVTHALLVGTIIVAGATAKHSVAAEDKPIRAFITQGAAPPPPPPPPPPPAASSSAPRRATPKIDPVQPKPVTPVNPMTPPVEIPREVPKVQPLTPSTGNEETTEEPSSGADTGSVEGGVEGGVVGGVAGGVQGGVIGGEVGGVVGGEIGGVKGGVVGGVVGGQVGGTGTGTEGTGTGGKEAPVAEPEPPPAPPAGPMRVGGDVSAPTVANRVNPEYTEPARRAKVTGVVVVEAVIDKNGNVDRVRIVRDLPMGLGEAAVRAVKQWKFKPGRYGGQPVDVIFNLTVNFTLNE